MTPRPAVSFVVPVRNDAVRLRRCLASIASATPAGVDIQTIVADNGSTDESAAVARQFGATVVTAPERVVADVRNAGARAADADLLAFVDADHELDARWVDAAIAVMQNERISAAGADYLPPPGGTWVQTMYDRLRRHPTEVEDTDWLPSGNLVVRRSVFEAVEGFDTALESCEDVDLCRRIRQRGGRLVAAPTLRSIHFGDPRTLRAVFLSELWRGRDNLRVTFRDHLSLKSLGSITFTMLYLVGLFMLIGGNFFWVVTGGALPAIGAGLLLLLTGIRAARLLRAGGSPLNAVRFAGAFDAGRALALVVRVGHATRRTE